MRRQDQRFPALRALPLIRAVIKGMVVIPMVGVLSPAMANAEPRGVAAPRLNYGGNTLQLERSWTRLKYYT